MPGRRLAARAHFWGGLVLGPLVLLLGLSGAVLVFRAELDDALHGPPVVKAGGPVRSLDAVVAAALYTVPGGEARALRVPVRTDRPYRVEVHRGAQRVDVDVDPYTLAVVHGRAPERSPLVAVHSLHAALHAGRAGSLVVAVLGLALVAESATGLWLYGPFGRRRPWTSSLRGVGRMLHRQVGGAVLALSLVVGVTGAALAVAGAASVAAAPASPARLARLDAVAARATSTVPGAALSALVAERDGRVRVETRAPTAVFVVDTDTGGIVTAPPANGAGPWDVVRRLHYGDFGGWLSRLLYVAVGLALPALSLSGYVIAARRSAA